jgi:hypothetical protein
MHANRSQGNSMGTPSMRNPILCSTPGAILQEKDKVSAFLASLATDLNAAPCTFLSAMLQGPDGDALRTSHLNH